MSNSKPTLDLEFFSSLAHELRTQDNAMTADPLPTVQEHIAGRWLKREVFLTNAAAMQYCRQQAHNHAGKLRVYIESAYRNPEMRKLREQLLAVADHLNGGTGEEVEVAPVGHLAWQPMSDGLPTELRYQDTWLLLWARTGAPDNPLQPCRPWNARRVISDNAYHGRVFTHFRVIELPVGAESERR